MIDPNLYTSTDYFENIVTFLKENEWLFNYPNTDILVEKVLDKFPEEWIIYLKSLSNVDLNLLPFGVINAICPSNLESFIKKIESLKLRIEDFSSSDIEIPALPATTFISAKKQHEIVSLAVVVQSVCKQYNISTVIDVGAGLGYLSQLLYDRYQKKVLAIESNEKNVEQALKIQAKCYPSSKAYVKYVHHFITEDSALELTLFLKDNFEDWQENQTVCITGLHACADLSVTILNLFSKLGFASALVIMPCCYHRLKLQGGTHEEHFINFPSSKSLQSIYDKYCGQRFLRRPFLRLACQQSRGAWKRMSATDHLLHSKSCLFRAVVQDVAYEENLEVRRLKRKTGKFKTDSNCTIEDLVDNLKNTHQLVPREGLHTSCATLLIDDFQIKSKILEKWNLHKDDCSLVEALTAFQTSIQSICENLVLLDRVELLREKGLSCNVYKVTDDRISPRCHAIVATKQ